MPDDLDDVGEALELAAGLRLSSSHFERRTVLPHDCAVTRKTIMLFLENLDPAMTVGEVRERLDR